MNFSKVFATLMLSMSITVTSCVKEPDPIHVTGITLDTTSLTLTEGESARLTATISPSNADNQGVIWSSSNASVASVSNGIVTAVSAGSAAITAKSDDGGKTATCNVTVNSKIVAVTGVSLDKTSLELTEGDENTLVATVQPANASNTNVSWSSSNNSIASVENGKVKALKPGKVIISAKSEDGGKTANCSVTVNAKTISATGVSLNKSSLSLEEGETASLTATVYPSNATNKNVTWKSSNNSVATVSSSGLVKAIKAGYATITVMTEDVVLSAACSVTVSGYSTEYVDLGLSVKWATCNLGASKPEDYGLYYQWGDTQGWGCDTSDGKYFEWKDRHENVTYKWSKGSFNSLTKYNTMSSFGIVDNKTVLDKEDDAAYVTLGGKWRMPTIEEWTELRENCTWSWTTQNGVEGVKVTSKKSGYTSRSIFLPLAGYRVQYLHELGMENEPFGDYWSSSLFTSYPSYASMVYIYYWSSKRISYGNRSHGLSIRPVCD